MANFNFSTLILSNIVKGAMWFTKGSTLYGDGGINEEDLIVLDVVVRSPPSLTEDFLVYIDRLSIWQVSLKYSIGFSCFSLCSSCIDGPEVKGYLI